MDFEDQKTQAEQRQTGDLVFSLSRSDLLMLKNAAKEGASVELPAAYPNSQQREIVPGIVNYSVSEKLLQQVGSKVLSTSDAGVTVQDIPASLFFGHRNSVTLPGEFAGLLAASHLPPWLSSYPEEVRSLVSGRLDSMSKWDRFSSEELVEKHVGLMSRYPNRQLIPLLQRADNDNVLCLQQDGSLVIIHDYASDGFELVRTYRSVDEFRLNMVDATAKKYENALAAMIQDPRYVEGITWGQKRSGHPEGSIESHIRELNKNVEAIADSLDATQLAKLKIFVHTHDTFKGSARKGAKIMDPDSHASLARTFVEEFLGETELSSVIQHHDVLYSMWRSASRHGDVNREQLAILVREIKDWDLFMTTKLVDNITEGKDLAPTIWAIDLVTSDPRIPLSISPAEQLDRILIARNMTRVDTSSSL